MESVILSGPPQCKIRRKFPLPSGYEDNYYDSFDPFVNGDPSVPADEPEEESDPYFIWRRNAPFLYDSVSVYNLDWPSLVVEFMDDSSNFKVKNGILSQRLLLSTHTSGTETEFAMVGEIRMGVHSLRENLTTCENYNGFLSYRKSKEGGLSQPSTPILDIKAKIVHPGEVNRISHVPKSHFSFLTQSNNGILYLFDYSKHPSNPRDLKTSLPQLVLRGGHLSEGYGISWNSSNKVASCASDGTLCLWDLNSRPSGSTKDLEGVSDNATVIGPLSCYSNGASYPRNSDTSGNSPSSNDQNQGSQETKSGSNGLNDVEFLKNDDNVVLTSCDDGNVYLVDFRMTPNSANVNDRSSDNSVDAKSVSSKKFTNSVSSLESGVNCISLNCFDSNYFVCGCENGDINLFDIRVPQKSLLLLQNHKESVTQIEFNRACCGLFASSSNDSTVSIFDLGCRGQELRFVHQGHKSQVNDISWVKLDPFKASHVGFTLASVSQDNLLQCYTPNFSNL